MQSQIHIVENDINEKHKQSLEAAFAFFNETSAQLTSSYRMLEGRVKQLSEELDRVSDEKEAVHQKKDQLASRMQALLDFLPGGVIVLDSKGVIVEANPAAEDLLSYELKGQLWRKVIAACFAPKNDDGLEISTRSGKRISIATSSMQNDGQIILLTDQTETRRLQENLSRNERLSALGKMVSALAHQIRTPLSAAILYAGHLTNENLDNSKRSVFANKLFGRLQHMEKQVRDMLLFVKNELPLNDIASLADLEIDFRDAAEVALATSNSSCDWQNLHPNKTIKCHRDALISALMNLVNNGIQACEQSAQIKVIFDVIERDEKQFARISVCDNGPGMNASALQEAQNLFVTTKPQGTGLGLSVVNSVARAHGGQLYMQSQIGKGTCAFLELPLIEKNTAV
ncbi:Sensor protein ZraS [Thalassocella blandensis]|nr:Sensor protein ZraS [Thalassocella blandensis]